MPGPAGRRTTPHLLLRNALGIDDRRRLIEVIETAVVRSGVSGASRWRDGEALHRAIDFHPNLTEAVIPLTSALTAAAATARDQLGIAHFRLAGIPHRASVQTPESSLHSPVVGADVPAGRRIEFVYTMIPDRTMADGAAVRIHDTLLDGGQPRAHDTFAEVELVDDSLLLFPSGHHHEFTKLRPAGGSPNGPDRPVIYAVRGWLAGDPLGSPVGALTREAANLVQAEFLPRFTDAGYEIRPTPAHVQKLLTGLLEMRGHRRHPEEADAGYHGGHDPEFVDIDGVADDLLRELKPVHEAWSGTDLVACAAYGMRSYRDGSTLVMHVDRTATHVISSILQVSQDADEPWPLELDLDGRGHEVILQPGQMLLYEGASTPHGRPRPFRGRHFVNLFLHYRPAEWHWTPELLARRAFDEGLVDASGRLL